MSNNKLKDLDNLKTIFDKTLSDNLTISDNLKTIFDKTISDSLKAYQAKADKIVADAKTNINKLTRENKSLRKEINSYKTMNILIVEVLKEIRGKATSFSEFAIESCDKIEALLLPTGSKEDMGTEYKEDTSDFESDEEDIEEEDKTEYKEDASDFESDKEDIEEEDKDLDDESASKGEKNILKKRTKTWMTESASKGEVSAKRKKPL